MFFKFFKNKKSQRKEDTHVTLDEILKGIDELPDEEKEKVKAKIQDLNKAEDEREIDKIEEEKADDAEDASEKSEEVKEEGKEIAKDIDTLDDELDIHKLGDRLAKVEELLSKLTAEQESKGRESKEASKDDRSKLEEAMAIYQ